MLHNKSLNFGGELEWNLKCFYHCSFYGGYCGKVFITSHTYFPTYFLYVDFQ